MEENLWGYLVDFFYIGYFGLDLRKFECLLSWIFIYFFGRVSVKGCLRP